jgi:hypothetical protein
MIGMGRYTSLALLVGIGAATAAVSACSSVVFIDNPGAGAGSATGGAGGATTSSTVGPITTSTSTSTSSTGGQGGAGGEPGLGGACGTVSHETTLSKREADIIFVIDNSGSMSEEINAVEANINVNFAQIIGSSNVDYRVIMLTTHGVAPFDVCVAPPLSGTTNCAAAPVNVPGQFYHYSLNIQSHDSVCKALHSMYGAAPDDFGMAPNGWNDWLRPAAVKIWVEITDDSMACGFEGTTFDDGNDVQQGQQAAIAWDQKLLGMNHTQFGTPAERNYLFYSIVGMPENGNMLPYEDNAPVETGTCFSGEAAGTGYQWLSKGTGALRFPVCSFQSYDAVFNDIAAGVIEVTAVPCEWDMPEPDFGEIYDYDTLDIGYTVNGMGEPQSFNRVDNESQCTVGAYYVEPEHHVVLCPQACDVVRADNEAELSANVWCE